MTIFEIGHVASAFPERSKTRQKHALVVCVYDTSIILTALNVDTVVDDVIAIDDAGLAEPVPFSCGPMYVILPFTCRYAVCKGSSNRKKKLVGTVEGLSLTSLVAVRKYCEVRR